jgi:hypothetical protein
MYAEVLLVGSHKFNDGFSKWKDMRRTAAYKQPFFILQCSTPPHSTNSLSLKLICMVP